MKRKACECLRVPPEGHFQKSLIMRHKNLMIRDFFMAGPYGICRPGRAFSQKAVPDGVFH